MGHNIPDTPPPAILLETGHALVTMAQRWSGPIRWWIALEAYEYFLDAGCSAAQRRRYMYDQLIGPED